MSPPLMDQENRYAALKQVYAESLKGNIGPCERSASTGSAKLAGPEHQTVCDKACHMSLATVSQTA